MSEYFKVFFDNLPYILIPFISGLVGWITNVLALKMTFYPLEYRGLRPFGWQGIVPSRAAKMAKISVDLMADKLINVKDVFSRLDPVIISEIMNPGVEKLSFKIINEIMMAQAPKVWRLMPKSYKQKIYDQVKNEAPEITRKIMQDIKDDVRELLDLKALAVSVLMNDKSLINKIFLEVGHKEFKFIERSGFYFGFLFGIVQMIIFIYFNPWWLLPVAGLFVGFITNWLAIKMIFRPVKEYKIFKFRIQGIFFKRQKEVSQEYAKIVTEKILTTENFFDFIMRGPDTRKISQIIYKHIGSMIDKTAESYKKMLIALGGEARLQIVKNIAVYRFKEELPPEIPVIYHYATKSLDLRNEMQQKMSVLSPKEFEGFLHPVFEEDEYKLIIVGAVLGGIAGLLQYFIFFY